MAVGSIALLSEARAEAPAANRTPVEHVTKRPVRRDEGLGTIEYRPSDKERPFFDKLDAKEKAIGGQAEGYDLEAKDRKFAGWFGIVRAVTEDAEHDQTVLTVEHKYFDGLTDAHIQAVSFNGGGDFRAVLRGVGHEIPPLSLVRAYGTPAAAKDAGMPRVDAVFVRDWHWGAFTFLAAYGKQKDSEQWRRLNRVALEEIYDPYPDEDYYEQRLGKRAADDPLYRRLLKPAGEVEADAKGLMIEVIDSLLHAKDLYPVLDLVQNVRNRHEEQAAIAVLLAAVKEDEMPSWAVCSALGRLAGPDELPPLTALLSDANPDIRARAAEALSEMGKAAAPAVPALVKALRDAEPGVRSGAAGALGMIGIPARAAVEPLKESLKDRDGSVRLAAAAALWAITFQAEPAVSMLVAGLKDADTDVRAGAARALESMGPAAVAAGPALIAALKDKDQDVRYSVVTALQFVRPEPKTAVPAIMATLKDEDSYVRAQAADALGRYGAAAQPAVPALVAALKDESESVRWQSADALGQIGPPAAKAVSALIDVLQHDTAETARRSSAEALGSIDAEGRAAVPALIQALSDQSAKVRQSAAAGLGKIGPKAKAALTALKAATKDEEPLQIVAAEALWKIDRDSDTAMPVLLRALADGNYPGLAAGALGTIGPAAKTAVPALAKVLRQENGYAQNCAAQALGNIGPGAEAAVPALVDALELRDDAYPCAVDAAEALWRINQHPRAIPVLVELLATDNGVLPAAEALGRIGPAAKEALPALREAANNPDPAVRQAVTEALRKVSGQAPAKTAKDQPKKP
jgi:HEAT repeat protein